MTPPPLRRFEQRVANWPNGIILTLAVMPG
jgi:hypothetical protein